MNQFGKIIVIVAVIAVVQVPTHSRGNVVFVAEPLATFGSPHMPLLYTEKANMEMMAAQVQLKGSVQGTVSFYQPHGRAPVLIVGKLMGLPAGRNGLFITEFGDSQQSCANTGPVWDMPFSSINYGWPFSKPLGDLGPIMARNDSTADILNSHNLISLMPGHPANILGRGLIVATMPKNMTMAMRTACGPIFAAKSATLPNSPYENEC